MSQLEQITHKIFSKDRFRQYAERCKNKGNTIVFTNGCFDILHLGHVDYLSKAKDLGDKLIVGVNSDASVKRLNKGKSRPIQDENSRATIVAALQFVDAVCIFDEDTPLELITLTLPDVLIKGSDYKLDQVVGKDIVEEFGGEVKLIDFMEGYSTSAIEKKIKAG
jgi:D-glycero-beta-D-manno-heptose 1-phosphate adenylyltransferase